MASNPLEVIVNKNTYTYPSYGGYAMAKARSASGSKEGEDWSEILDSHMDAI
jgi:hypothetical protein